MHETVKNPLGLNSVRIRLILLNFGVLAFVLMTLGIALSISARVSLENQADGYLAINMQDLVRRFQAAGMDDTRALARARQTHATLFFPSRLHYYTPLILDVHGNPSVGIVTDTGRHAESAKDSPFSVHGFQSAVSGKATYIHRLFGGEQVSIYCVPLESHGAVVGVVEYARSRSDILQEIDRIDRRLLALIPLAILSAGLGGAFLTINALDPVRKIAQAAQGIEAAGLSGRLPVVGNDEFAELAVTINGMLSRIEDSFQKLERAYDLQRRFAADASHELRSPLTVIKANASLELIEAGSRERLQAAIEAIDKAADRTNKIVEDLLLLARSDAGELKPDHQPISLDSCIFQALEICKNRKPKIVLDSEEGLGDGRFHIMGDQDAIIRLFSNILDNAMRHTPATGSIKVSARQAGDSVIVTVVDTGEGIAAQHIPHLTERFYRVDKARTRKAGGTGLGLAICKSIVELHDGSLIIESELGRGTSVTVLLPIVWNLENVPELPAHSLDTVHTA